MAEKIRLDQRITELGLCESREKAKAAIMAGDVYVNGQKALKAGDNVKPEDKIEVRSAMEFVSRGGYKLKKAMGVFPITLENKVCMDIGASTGGFSDCMLQNGARHVYCVDVGYGQLAWKIRSDERVTNFERTNIRYFEPSSIPELPDFISVDVSFISLKHIFPKIDELLKPDGQAVCLIKPQFEAGREKVGKKGVVREQSTHIEVIEAVLALAVGQGFTVLGLDYSPIKGPEGNIEYLLYIGRSGENAEYDIPALVAESHTQLENAKH